MKNLSIHNQIIYEGIFLIDFDDLGDTLCQNHWTTFRSKYFLNDNNNKGKLIYYRFHYSQHVVNTCEIPHHFFNIVHLSLAPLHFFTREKFVSFTKNLQNNARI